MGIRNNMMKRISVDFDGTLTRADVQRLVKRLMKENIEVHITTSRDKANDFYGSNHKDLFDLANKLKISVDNIHFLNYASKATYFAKEDFMWHLDDCWMEVDIINEITQTIGICVLDPKWYEKCLDFLHRDVLDSVSKNSINKYISLLNNN